MPGVFRIKVTLPESPLKYLNSYVFKSDQRSLVVDTGLNRPECRQALEAGLAEIGVAPAGADYFITHLHADHFGLVGAMAGPESLVYFNQPDADILNSGLGWESVIEYSARNGFPAETLRPAIEKHPGKHFHSPRIPAMTILADGDEIAYGDYRLRALHTPGHTPGHLCLYDSAARLLVAGDHLLIDITPNIQCMSDDANPLGDYLASLEKTAALDVALVAPGHRRLWTDHRARIDELRVHHARRVEEAFEALRGGPLDAFQVAARMTWDIKCDSWEDFPLAQKWFAQAEALSHLRYLERRGQIDRLDEGGLTIFAIAA